MNRLKQKCLPSRQELQGRSSLLEAIKLSNRYALFFAGHVGLALLNSEKQADIKSQFTFGPMQDGSKDKEEHTATLVKCNSDDLVRVLEAKRKQEGKVNDDDLRGTLEAV